MVPAAPFLELCHDAGSTWPNLIVGPAIAIAGANINPNISTSDKSLPKFERFRFIFVPSF
jgi:hypothetical protein